MQGQVLVKNEYVGVSFTDTYFRSGLYPRPSYPAGLGEEGAGTVVAVGPGKPLEISRPTRVSGLEHKAWFETSKHATVMLFFAPRSPGGLRPLAHTPLDK